MEIECGGEQRNVETQRRKNGAPKLLHFGNIFAPG
jgi:hypothetical protein